MGDYGFLKMAQKSNQDTKIPESELCLEYEIEPQAFLFRPKLLEMETQYQVGGDSL